MMYVCSVRLGVPRYDRTYMYIHDQTPRSSWQHSKYGPRDACAGMLSHHRVWRNESDVPRRFPRLTMCCACLVLAS